MVVDHLYSIGVAIPETKHEAVAARELDGIGTLAITLESMDLVGGLLQLPRAIAALQPIDQVVDLVLDLLGIESALALGESLAAPASP